MSNVPSDEVFQEAYSKLSKFCSEPPASWALEAFREAAASRIATLEASRFAAPEFPLVDNAAGAA